MTLYIAAYDTETSACLAACWRIVEVHRRHEMPATFFITGKALEARGPECRALLDDPSLRWLPTPRPVQKLIRSPECAHGVLTGN